MFAFWSNRLARVEMVEAESPLIGLVSYDQLDNLLSHAKVRSPFIPNTESSTERDRGGWDVTYAGIWKGGFKLRHQPRSDPMAPEYSIPSLEQQFKTSTPTGVIHVVGRTLPQPAASVKKLYSRYPVKLLCPQMGTNPISKTCYMMGYGGGIVQGDITVLDGAVTGGANLTLLTQGSTKVFKNPSRKPSAQASTISVGKGSSCLFLPDPVVCFTDAIYHQHQAFDLEDETSSLVMLDWYSSGRKESGEVWGLRSYFSKISIRMGGVLKARDITTLIQQGDVPLPQRMGEHSTFATMFLVGPRFQELAASLLKEFELFKVDPSLYRKDLMWFVAPLDEISGGVILRAAARDTDALRIFFRLRFASLGQFVDPDRMFL